MLINVVEELKKARKGGYAIGAFNTSNLEVTKAICDAAEKNQKPVIIQTTPSAIKYAGLEQLFNIVKTEIEESSVDAAIHLDHGKNFEIVKRCIDIGYRSVMIDGSKLPFEENVALTKKVVGYAKTKNVSVEAEIGVISAEGGGINIEGEQLSSSDQTKKFVELTSVDSIAISVGNKHGAPKEEKLNLKLLEEIVANIKIPLVMHGASGLSENDIKAAIKIGVCKFNIDTKIKRAFSEEIEKSEEEDYRKILKEGMDEVVEVVDKYIRLFSLIT